MNIITMNKAVMLCDELGRHNINCTSAAEAEKLGRRLREDKEFASTMLGLCRPGAPEACTASPA